MLIPYGELCQKFKIKPTGILHIGASTGQEAQAYYDNGITRTVWIEADPKVFAQLQENLKKYPDSKPINACISYVDGFEVPFYVTDNNGESSSLLEMGAHKDAHPDVKVVETIQLKISRVDTVLKENNLKIADYDMMNLDIQGAELNALRSTGILLREVNYVYCEVNNKEVYIGCPPIEAIDEFLLKYDLVRVETKWAGDTGWGDAMYIRKGLIPSEYASEIKQAENRLERNTQPANKVKTTDVYEAPKAQAGQLSLSNLIDKFEMKVYGIINIGAHKGDQIEEYKKLGIKKVACIEPSSINYQIMTDKYRIGELFFNTALADFNGSGNMFVSAGNDGAANSFLRPSKIFMTQFQKVSWPGMGTEQVAVNRLDNLGIDVGLYNMISIDTNGTEKLALLGGVVTMGHMHYILAKVYFAEVYEGCTQVDELDKFLSGHGFMRVETDKSGVTYGQALYAKSGHVKLPYKNIKPAEQAVDISNEYLELKDVENDFVQKVPEKFRPHLLQPKPEDNIIPFEEWFYKSFSFEDQREERVYLPIFWNSFYCNDDKNDKFLSKELQKFIDSLDKTKKYYTITSHEHGILENLDGLDVQVFAMQANLPLVCAPHKFEFPGLRKDIFVSFIGNITDPIRERLVDIMPRDNSDFYITTKEHSLEEYCKILARSKYVLCPRGRAYTSFRVCEALQYGAVPVYIHDSSPKQFKDMVGIDADDTTDAMAIFDLINDYEMDNGYSSIDKDGKVKSFTASQAKYNYVNRFTFAAIKKQILDNIK